MQHNSLLKYLKTNFELKSMYNYTYSEIENMIPWERDVVIDLIKQKLEEEKDG